MSLFFSYGPYFNSNAINSPLEVSLDGAQSLTQIEKAYGGWSFFHTQNTLPAQKINLHNQKMESALRQDLDLPAQEGRVPWVTNSEANEVYESMKNNNVVRCDLSYERPGQSIGFCFGRATIAHMEALRMGVHPEAIRKIWVIGDMGHWGHHVATMVKTENGWKVLDNVTGFVSPEDWMTQMKAQTRGDKPLMFFSSNAERFGPASNAGYDPTDLFGSGSDDYYNSFFRDYFSWLDEQPAIETFAARRSN